MVPAAAPVLIGQITSAHGVRGHVLIRTYTDLAEDIASYGPVWDETGERQFELALVRITPKGVIARITGIDDRTAAEALRGTRLFIGRERLPPTGGAEEFYHSDLIGLNAIRPDGTPMGEVIAVHNFGAGDILEIRQVGARSTEMVPFTHAFVPNVDIAEGRLTVALPSEGEEEDT